MAFSASYRPTFVSVDVVVREKPQIEALDHVVRQVKSLLDVSNVLSVARAAEHQPLDAPSLSLLKHAAAREKRKLRHWSSELTRSYRQYQFETALNIAAGRGCYAGVRWLRSAYYPKGKFHGVERAAMYSGNLQMLRYLHDEFSNKMKDDAVVSSQDAVAHAAANGRVDLVHWFCEMKGPYAFGWNVMDAAVAQNRMEVVQYLDRVLGNRCTRRGLEEAAFNGHLEVVKWLQDSTYYEIRTFKTLENAIAGGHLHIVKYIMEHVVVAYTSWMHAALIAAMAYGQRHILHWLHDRASAKAARFHERFRVSMNTTKLYTVARRGHLNVLQWLHDHDYPVHCRRFHAVRGAVRGGHQRILEWMERTFPALVRQRHRIRVDGAASLGNLELIQWLHSRGYRLTTHVMDDAAARGHLAVVSWLHENVANIRCTVAAMDRAAANGHLGVVQFLHAHRTEGCTSVAMDEAARSGHLDVVQFLYTHRSEYCTALAGESHSVPVLEFLKTHHRLRSRLPDAIDAATRGELDLLQWLYAHDRRHFAFAAVVEEAREHNNFYLLRWLETLPEAGR
ncbi:hypothetical protein PsorP6_018094 [Peronosclerospora sorghi]|uniref:Uncharacterized protein n=1 Tax=Peronosclerospora sorghi TaxID=230839 RepID=A0ACC0WFL7_9STRA|nr:hypothetical protein PsorP6_018094 [Peronosclerospora sorghi]